MKRVQVILLLLFISCEPGYRIIVGNKYSTNIYIETVPTRESLMSSRNYYYDSIISKKINVSDSIGIYRLRPQEIMGLYGHLGRPSDGYFPYKSVKIIKEGDTIEVNKENILGKITREEKRFSSGTYYIEVY